MTHLTAYQFNEDAVAKAGSLREYVDTVYGSNGYNDRRQIREKIIEEVAAGKCHKGSCPDRSAIKHAQLANALRVYKALEGSPHYKLGELKLVTK
jgi:hypothetical protein